MNWGFLANSYQYFHGDFFPLLVPYHPWYGYPIVIQLEIYL
ncbi:hypothetical protein B6N60_00864 [Richelia sinica FACHB-800]|uniref:Uncharacterized protein n=1 Tax=Richelia sinica FACHB-800 TaxID=1357546 RepID=A0A975Y3I9_9NOST|nr:hypothetical protein B6N60_00864 [Richelia sinica FACHB-800]